jgi:L-threonylcarbamoyladenylate synthase
LKERQTYFRRGASWRAISAVEGPVKRWKFADSQPDDTQLDEIAALLASDQIVILPTDTIYGIHARAGSTHAVERIFSAKERERGKPLPVLFSNLAQLETSGAVLSKQLRQALDQIWPAPMTAIVPLKTSLPATSGAASVAARIPATAWLRDLLARTGPLASTSANLSGKAPSLNPAEFPAELLRSVGGLADGGVLEGRGSTIVDFTVDPPKIVRSGDFFFSQKLWKKVWKSL